ncbi:MAG: hypothetical protein EHM13_05625 [Acidobacteria bacterium]|nr:MAG: hypothetical protein EHM13_05625 [Acidobacteriota bacterium]
MPGFEYKDGCLLCNQCGRLNDPPDIDVASLAECPCGNSESLEAIEGLIDLFNAPPKPPARPTDA